MKSEFVEARNFIRGVATRSDLVCVISQGKALLKHGISHASLIGVWQGRWADGVNTEWDSTAIATAQVASEQRPVTIGEDGDVVVYLGQGKSRREKISPDPVLIRNARGISGYAFACGMKRQVYKRVDKGKWLDVSAPFPAADVTAGFEALDGYSLSEIYAVGWGGEVWEFDGTNWTERSSPTDQILSCVCCAPNDVVYVGGQSGMLLTGRHGSWEAIQWEDEVTADIWDVCWFDDKLYVATTTNLYTLNGNTLIDVDFGEIGTPTCYSLTSCDGVLWSIGQDDVASFDGKNWQIYD